MHGISISIKIFFCELWGADFKIIFALKLFERFTIYYPQNAYCVLQKGMYEKKRVSYQVSLTQTEDIIPFSSQAIPKSKVRRGKIYFPYFLNDQFSTEWKYVIQHQQLMLNNIFKHVFMKTRYDGSYLDNFQNYVQCLLFISKHIVIKILVKDLSNVVTIAN